MTPDRAERGTRRLRALVAPLALLWLCASGCAAQSVKAYQREHLADRIMSFQAEAREDARRTKSFEAREGSTGGNGGAGGGCACN
jgi:hypothetical protein